MLASRTALWGILLALGGTVALSVNDTAVKSLSGGYPLHQVVLARAVVGLAVIVALAAWTRAGPVALVRTRRPVLHALRVTCVLSSNMLFFLGLAALPLADGVAIFFVAPLLVTALSVPLLGERVGPRRWAAVGAGLLGAVVMMRPGAGAVQPAALLMLGAALAYALMHILTRRMAATESSLAMSFWTQAGFVALSLALGLAIGDGRFGGAGDPSLDFLLRAWRWPEPRDWPVFLVTGLAVTAGGLMVTEAYRLCEAGLVAPFEYAAVPLAVVWGAVVFGTWPDAVGWTGIALVVGAGLYMLWRETRAGRPAAAGPAATEGSR